MKTIKEFIAENNIDVDVVSDDKKYVCYITGEEGTFKFKMTREKLVEHIRKFSHKDFADTILSNENMVKTHFTRLAVTWWHIAVFSDERNMEIK